jgi:bifunctional DNA-binding transcriptional regulator/antitoxin component of YhaV-PrlF toxin-antitoxin module
MSKLSSKNQITIPVEALRDAGLRAGDQVTVRATGRGRLEVVRDRDWLEELAGSMPGVWPPGAAEELRREWER